MEVFKVKIQRIAHKTWYRLKTFVFAHWLKMLFFVALGFFTVFLVRLEKGTFAYCTDELVHCLEETALTEKGVKRAVNVLKCAVKLPVCDVHTIWFMLTDERSGVQQELDKTPEEKTAETSFENKTKGDIENGLTVFENEPEEEISGPALFEEMKRLRREREIFEKNQNELRKKIFEALESKNKPDILSVNTAQENQQETPHE